MVSMPTALAISSTRSGSCSSMSMPKCPVGMTSPLAFRYAVSSATLAGSA